MVPIEVQLYTMTRKYLEANTEDTMKEKAKSQIHLQIVLYHYLQMPMFSCVLQKRDSILF